MRFKKEDIGRRVLIELDAEKHLIAKALGADVYVIGKILALEENYVRLLAEMPVRLTPLQQKPKERDIPYETIKTYEFL